MTNAKNFKDSYEVLQRHAQTLRNETEPNIDDLLRIVTESVESYKVCRERIDAVDEALKAALAGAGMPGAAGAPPTASHAPAPASAPGPVRPATPSFVSSALDDSDDDIPF